MEYGINFDNDNANENILSALAELNNTFFIENDSSSDEKSISDNEIIPNVNDIEDDTQSLVENFNEMHLNNFEFMENSDSYIEDKVYVDIKLKVKEFFDKGKCTCNFKCFEKIGYERFLTRRIEFEALNKDMRNMVIKGQLMAFQHDENTKKVTANNRKFFHFKYCFNNSTPICRSTYQALVGVDHSYLDNVIKHLREFGLEERIHDNTGNVPKNMIRVEVNYDMACEIYNFLKNYSDIHVEDGKRNPNKTKTQILFKSFEESAHITYDWAQNVHVPYSSQQVGSLFFKSPRKVHLFGVCNTGNFPHTEQTNYVIDEGEMPDDGKLGKGVNCTISLVWHAIKKYNCGEKKLIITCDNCVGQNKNNYFLFFYSWLIDRGVYEEVEMNFMIPGHTKFICDSCFGLIKIFYRKSKVNTVDDMASIVDNSTTVHLNASQRFLNGEGFQYYNFKDYFQKFKKIPNIQKYHHFYFTSQHPGVVFYKDKLEDSHKETTVRNFSFNFNTQPSIINIRPLSLKRQEELYKEITPYVDLPFRNITCPNPNEHIITD
ncbi:hypothetical protein RhiirA1_437444 [Rhizophagus irregularis]|uniref:DUF7869 domain-containing protein n=2 Tax=Rhizophagus irregularis TaxID=588596 RepID=A0A2N0SDP3_9GLOM|nr:hypothetical protein RhiirA1_437444 [Rhizophagus irregularis]